jgi:hypothetical protein
MPGRTLFTVGHSTREADELVTLLQRHGVDRLVDVRRYPGSRRHPHFNRESLAQRLTAAGIGYRHAPELGGRRDPAPASHNQGWRNASFRAYADYMATPPFLAALDRLLHDAQHHSVAIMCAEAVPWRCHRNLISDAIVARGGVVRHILGHDADPTTHDLNPMAHLGPDGTLTYPGAGMGTSTGQGTGTGTGMGMGMGTGMGTGEGGGEGSGRGERPGDAGGADGSQHELFA